MSKLVKRIYGDYVIDTTAVPTANVTLNASHVFINGNLQVGGNATAVTKTDLDITDNIITLNKGEVGPGVTTGFSGFSIDRGSAANVYLFWKEGVSSWVVYNGTTERYILTGTASSNLALIDDPSPTLGANLNVYNKSIYSNVSLVKFDNNTALKYTTVDPTATASYATIYAKTPSQGGTGVYITTIESSTSEVATRRTALVYSLVL
jgi:hypothetical protein